MLEGENKRSETTITGMVDIDLSNVSMATGIPISADDSRSFSRLSTSMFNPNMS